MLHEELYPHTKKLNVLYVEDSLTLRKVTARMLGNLFASLDIAKDGDEAFECYGDYYKQYECFYDIVITDLEMPRMDGQQLSQQILNFNATQEIVVISGSSDFKKVVELINLGVQKFISKPIAEDALYQVLFDVAQNIRQKRLNVQEQQEIADHNAILKQREEAYLRKLEKSIQQLGEFNDALDASTVVSKTDIEGTITYVNDKFCRISGYRREELLGQNHRIVNSGTMSRSFFMKLWRTITSKQNYQILFQNRAKDGSIYYIETLIKPILDVDGEIIEFIAVSHDMTQLIESLQSEQQARKSKEEFFINISHEMRTPLNAILGFSALLKKRIKEDKKASELLAVIHESGNELQKLIESMLDIRKIKENSLVLKETMFNPLAVLGPCVEKYVKMAQDKEQSYHCFIAPTLPDMLLGDSARIIQVLCAILDNAVKFTPKMGSIEVNIFYEDENEKLIVQVKDSGVGIAEEDQKKIFNFQQASASLNRSHEGAGLGLSIAGAVMKLMEGVITLESVPEQGSVFTLEFPLKCC